MTDLSKLSQAELIALVQAMKSQGQRKINVKVSEKGAISIYGLGRFPFTFYASQFDRLFSDETIAELRAFRKTNAALLAVKD